MASDKQRVLFDANILFDVLTRREPHYLSSAAAWELAETGEIEGYVAAHTITTMHYLIARRASIFDATQAVKKILLVFKIAPIDIAVIETALSYNWKDFEDAVQQAAAEKAACQLLVTRNVSDYKEMNVRIISPADLPAVL